MERQWGLVIDGCAEERQIERDHMEHCFRHLGYKGVEQS
jgi:hypothetical protein